MTLSRWPWSALPAPAAEKLVAARKSEIERAACDNFLREQKQKRCIVSHVHSLTENYGSRRAGERIFCIHTNSGTLLTGQRLKGKVYCSGSSHRERWERPSFASVFVKLRRFHLPGDNEMRVSCTPTESLSALPAFRPANSTPFNVIPQQPLRFFCCADFSQTYCPLVTHTKIYERTRAGMIKRGLNVIRDSGYWVQFQRVYTEIKLFIYIEQTK